MSTQPVGAVLPFACVFGCFHSTAGLVLAYSIIGLAALAPIVLRAISAGRNTHMLSCAVALALVCGAQGSGKQRLSRLALMRCVLISLQLGRHCVHE